MSIVARALGATGKTLVKTGKPLLSGTVRKVAKEEMEEDFMKRLMPYRLSKKGAAIGATALVAANGVQLGSDIMDFNEAKTVGQLSVSTLANQVGVTPSNHSAKFVRDIPKELSTSSMNRINPFYERAGKTGLQYYDDNAGGDLVLALHKLR